MTQVGYPHPVSDKPRKRLSEEHKRRISESQKGRVFSDEHLAKLRANALSRKGISPSAETRAKQSIAAKKRGPHSLDSYIKGGLARRGKPKTFSNPEQRRQRLILAGQSPELRKARSERALKLWQERTPEQKAQIAERIAKKLAGRKANEAQLRGLALGLEKNKGETHWNYKGGKGRTYPKAFRLLRPLILERDGYRCVMCGDEKRNAVHHIDYNKQNNTFLNLVTLCHACNLRAESRANKDSWPTILRIYTENLFTERKIA